MGRDWKFLLLASVCAASTWIYAARVLIPHQIDDSALHGTPRGNLSDLYPRWLGARELLLHGRDPYSQEITREIQLGYYGRYLDPSNPVDPIDQQGFAYPVYVVFFLAPTVHLNFIVVQRIFIWILVLATVASAVFWLRFIRWKVSIVNEAAVVTLLLGSLPMLLAIKLQQLTLLATAMSAGAVALLGAERPIAAGVLLALATMKPQLVAPLVLWLTIWSFGDLKRRYRWCISFLLCMGVLFAASELFLPHWVQRFGEAAVAYQRYAQAIPALEAIFSQFWGRAIGIIVVGLTLLACSGKVKAPVTSAEFRSCCCLAMCLAVLLSPKFAQYNQVLLLPAVFWIARDPVVIWNKGLVSRGLLVIGVGLLGLQWLACTVLAGLSYTLPREIVERAWALPIWTLPLFPLVVTALMLASDHRPTLLTPATLGSS